jgi:hypothetical protein
MKLSQSEERRFHGFPSISFLRGGHVALSTGTHMLRAISMTPAVIVMEKESTKIR